MMDTTNLAVGTKAPDFTLPATNGSEISLVNYYTRNNVYLFFVREFS